MALVHGGSWIIGMNGEAYRAMGRPQLETLVMLIASSVYLAVYVYAAKQSLETFVWARFYLMLLGLAIQLLILKAVLSISLMRIFIWIASSITITFAAILLSSWLMTAEDMAPELQFTILAAFWLATALVAIGIVRTQFLTLRMETR